VALFARVSHPFIPFASVAIAASVGDEFPQAWPERLELLPAGRKVAAGEVLFRKIEDVQVAEWVERFGGADAG
jgi:methionyl-tRNA synthetase